MLILTLSAEKNVSGQTVMEPDRLPVIGRRIIFRKITLQLAPPEKLIEVERFDGGVDDRKSRTVTTIHLSNVEYRFKCRSNFHEHLEHLELTFEPRLLYVLTKNRKFHRN